MGRLDSDNSGPGQGVRGGIVCPQLEMLVYHAHFPFWKLKEKFDIDVAHFGRQRRTCLEYFGNLRLPRPMYKKMEGLCSVVMRYAT